MLMKKLFTSLWALAFALGINAQTDVTSTYINGWDDFSNTTGWTTSASDSYHEEGSGLIGTYAVANNKTSTTDDTHLSTEYCFGFQCRWASNFSSFNRTTDDISLNLGYYTISYDVENTNSSTTSATYNNLFYVKVGDVTYADASTEWMSGESGWTTHSVLFPVDSETNTKLQISLGYGTGSNNYESVKTPHLYVSHLKMTYRPYDKTDLQTAITNATTLNAVLNDATLKSAIDAAQVVYDNASTDADGFATATAELHKTITTAETTLESNVYYLYDSEAKVFFSRGCAWGTEASADKYGIPLTLAFADGAYTIKNYTHSDQYVNGSGGVYTDQGTYSWTIAASGTGFTIANSDGKYLTHASGGYGESATLGDDAKVWSLFSKTERDAIVAAYSSENKTNVITAAGLTDVTADNFETTISGYVSSVVKTIGPNDYNWTKVRGNNANSSDPREVYEGTGNFTYSVTGLEAGLYKVSINTFERYGWNANNVTLANNGYYVVTSYLKAGNEQVLLKGWAEDRASDSNPNGVTDAKTLFDAGKYLSEVYVYVDETGTLDLTVAVPSYCGGHWFIMGNTVLTLYKDAVSEEESNNLITKAETLSSGYMNKDVKTALTTAKTALENDKTSKAKYQTLSDAVTNAQASVDAYAAAKTELDKRPTYVTNTNFYTAEAYAEYYTTPLAKYNAQTLTNDEAKALPESLGWHEAAQLNKFFGAAWGISNYDNAPNVNTWSVEGNSDGSNFTTPFYEYWEKDANSLADKTLTGTITGLDANAKYTVSAIVRVSIKTGETAPATGITMQVGDGDAVTIAGNQIGTSQRYYDTYTAIGETDASGNLTLKFNVASTNVSWLSFKNVNYTRVYDYTLNETAAAGEEGSVSYLASKYAGKKVDVSFTRNFTTDGYSTVCLPFDAATPTGGKFYTFTGVSDDYSTVTMTETTATTLSANIPYLFKPSADGGVTFTGTIESVESSYVPTDVTNDDWAFAGTYTKVTYNSDYALGSYDAVYGYVGAVTEGVTSSAIKVGDFVKLAIPGTSSTSAFRAVMKHKASSEAKSRTGVSGKALPSSMKVVLIDADGTATAIGTIDVEAAGDGAWYTINGLKLQGEPAAKGIYIHNGKKVLVK